MTPPQAGAPLRPSRFVATPFEEINGQFSPDGQWVAFQSSESGHAEIYVTSFPGPRG